MKCRGCEFMKVDDDKKAVCLKPVIDMDQECLLRHLVWDRMLTQEILLKQIRKHDKFVDDLRRENDEGEEWKGGLDI